MGGLKEASLRAFPKAWHTLGALETGKVDTYCDLKDLGDFGQLPASLAVALRRVQDRRPGHQDEGEAGHHRGLISIAPDSPGPNSPNFVNHKDLPLDPPVKKPGTPNLCPKIH